MKSPQSQLSEDSWAPSGQIVVTQSDGRQQLGGTGFLERLVGPTDIPVFHSYASCRQPQSFVSHNRRTSTNLMSPALTNLGRTPPAVPSPLLHTIEAQSDGDDDEDDDDYFKLSDSRVASSVGSSSGAQRLNPAQLRRRHDAEVQRLQEEIAASTKEGSTALKHMRIGTAAEKSLVTRTFRDLQRPEMKDTERLDVVAALESKERKYYSFVSSVMAPATALLRSMWDHRRVGNLERAAFGEKHFLQDAKNFVAINTEVMKYQKTKNSELVLLRLAGLRDTILATLRELMSAPVLCDPHIAIAAAEVHAIDVFNALLQLRHVTCEIVDVVTAKRTDEGYLKAEPLLWEGENYLIRMQNDVAKALSGTHAAILLGDTYPFQSNPMMLPAELLQLSQEEINEKKKKRQNQSSSSGLSLAPRASTPSPAVATPASRQLDKLSSTQRLSTSPASAQQPAANKRSSSGSIFVVAREGELLDASSSAAGPGTSASHTHAGLHKTLSQREVFFRRRMSEIQRSTTRIEMDRSNIYQYPASVYRPPPRPSWSRVAEMLQRSLDPRIRSSGYDELQEYERLQFGRITTPPSFFTPWRNPVIDDATQCFRTVVPDHQRFSYSELHKREVLIFGEQSFIRSQRCRRRFHRGVAKLSMAYRGFIVSLRNRRRGAPATVDEFLEWVRSVCPEWLAEARDGLATQGNADEVIAHQIYTDDLDDDS